MKKSKVAKKRDKNYHLLNYMQSLYMHYCPARISVFSETVLKLF